MTIDPEIEQEHVEAIQKWRADRDQAAVDAARARLRAVAATTENLVPATIELARAGGTVGEWAQTLRDVFGEYRAPTGVAGVAAPAGEEMHAVREKVPSANDGRPDPAPVGKPGLDSRSNGAEQMRCGPRRRDGGHHRESTCRPPKSPPQPGTGVDVVGLSILSGSHLTLVQGPSSALGRRSARAGSGQWHHPDAGRT